MSETTALLLDAATERGVTAQVWDATHEIGELVCRDGRQELRSDAVVDTTALTVWDGDIEGYATQTPADASLIDTALAVGRAVSGAAGAIRPDPDRGHTVRTLIDPAHDLDASTAMRLTALSARFPVAEVELRARVDRYRIDLHTAGGDPLSSITGTFSLQARITVRGQRVSFLSHRFHGRTADTVLAQAEEMADLVDLASVLADDPVTDPQHDHVLLDGRVVITLLDLLVPAFGLDTVLEGRSGLADRVGQRVAAPGLSIVDDPAGPDSPLRAAWDDEGTACRRTALVEDGVLRGFLSSRHTAAEHGSASTGAGRRGSSGTMPTVQPGFLVLRPAHDLGGPHRPGVTVLHVVQANGAHTSNPITGNFSIGANAVLVNPDGTRTNAGAITVAGNVFDLLADIDGHDGQVRIGGGDRSFTAAPGLWTTGLAIGR